MPKKILIIDDDMVQIKILSHGLKKHNYIVTTNTKGKKINEQIEAEKPDMILLDILLPDESGLVIAEQLNERDIPFIFISNSDNQIILKQACSSGALGFLMKPFNLDQLILEIEIAFYWHHEKTLLNQRSEQINNTIENNRKISVAIGIIMERYHIESSESFESIRYAARSKQCRILDIAEKLIEHHDNSLSSFSQTGCLNIISKDKKENLTNDQIYNEILKTIYINR